MDTPLTRAFYQHDIRCGSWTGTARRRLLEGRGALKTQGHPDRGGEESERVRRVGLSSFVFSEAFLRLTSLPRRLQERGALEWGTAVKLVFSDMRSFSPREKADIIVSELLGSFGDNELSPECLDGVMRCLKRELHFITFPERFPLTPLPRSRRYLHPILLHLLPCPRYFIKTSCRSDRPRRVWIDLGCRREARRAALCRHVLSCSYPQRRWRSSGIGEDSRVLEL
jgi:hypothetical protein